MKKHPTPKLPALFAYAGLCGLIALLTSCASNEQFEERMDRRTDGYGSYQDRREIRQDARQDRTDAWYDRQMH